MFVLECLFTDSSTELNPGKTQRAHDVLGKTELEGLVKVKSKDGAFLKCEKHLTREKFHLSVAVAAVDRDRGTATENESRPRGSGRGRGRARGPKLDRG